MRAQLLDINGNRLLGDSGILVSNCDGTIGNLSSAIIAGITEHVLNPPVIKRLYLNPVRDMLTASVIAPLQGTLHIYITDISGSVLKQYDRYVFAGSNSIQVNVGSLRSGSYFIK